ncbi:hypothetical protein HD553DRAFT_325048 [Filobasidium floriforme]|uniref:uncharacterized protein n=1 Tax=Filobasidium floriforme TaxID=5210 RepID=UPI001E8EF1AD|nr:uncharacterized protein HD553DRAFT_325048 [Filobasidium floriforme]KAH8082188.1 hypothetical protein HD553DRAFT_325048 [Filobasidium floriforme]
MCYALSTFSTLRTGANLSAFAPNICQQLPSSAHLPSHADKLSSKLPDNSAMEGLEMNPASNTGGSALTGAPSGTFETGQESMVTAGLQDLRLSNDPEQSDARNSSRKATTGSTADSQGHGVSEDETCLSETSEPEDEGSEELVTLTELGKLTDWHKELVGKGDSSNIAEARKIEAHVERTWTTLGKGKAKSKRHNMWEWGIGMGLLAMKTNTRRAEEAARERVQKSEERLNKGSRRSDRLKLQGDRVSSGRVMKKQNQ